MRIFLASGNAKKILEMQRILSEHVPDIEVLGIDDVAGYVEPVEDQPTFEGNALLKARAGLAATGLPSIADDSGLCVDALNGMPGVLSARWSGSDKADARNNALLLDQIEDVGDYLTDVGLIAALFCAISLVVGYVVPKAFGVTGPQAIASSMEVGVHNATLAIFVAVEVLDEVEISVPAAVYSLIMFLFAALWGMWVSKQVGERDSVAA